MGEVMTITAKGLQITHLFSVEDRAAFVGVSKVVTTQVLCFTASLTLPSDLIELHLPCAFPMRTMEVVVIFISVHALSIEIVVFLLTLIYSDFNNRSAGIAFSIKVGIAIPALLVLNVYLVCT